MKLLESRRIMIAQLVGYLNFHFVGGSSIPNLVKHNDWNYNSTLKHKHVTLTSPTERLLTKCSRHHVRSSSPQASPSDKEATFPSSPMLSILPRIMKTILSTRPPRELIAKPRLGGGKGGPIYKIIFMLLTGRLKKVMHKLVDKHKMDFLNERQIMDAVPL
ncbi:hypothetical protein H5410_017491 [Solanum commersonii]|uniref:Uncharacterized protein n=1 Tax=Solanum commersonii TaxID=4109 RepID=A0A9J6A039_SOLCO|nr:hypothetical protein H5410_017491 [Solanum commersonii]